MDGWLDELRLKLSQPTLGLGFGLGLANIDTYHMLYNDIKYGNIGTKKILYDELTILPSSAKSPN